MFNRGDLVVYENVIIQYGLLDDFVFLSLDDEVRTATKEECIRYANRPEGSIRK